MFSRAAFSETNDERVARLEHLSANQHLRLAAETNSERAARLEHLSDNQHLRLPTETNDVKLFWIAYKYDMTFRKFLNSLPHFLYICIITMSW